MRFAWLEAGKKGFWMLAGSTVGLHTGGAAVEQGL